MEDFETFLSRKYRQNKKWAGEERISAYRIYEKEIPEYPFVIDVYDKSLHISEVVKSEPKTEEWLEEFTQLLMKITGVEKERIFIKSRLRQAGKSQYERQDEAGETQVIQEGGLKFLVNLRDYLDTGLFLDHRISRELIKSKSEGVKFLNLFCYTGSFTVYAAAGGAFETTSVDLSSPYLEWAENNLKLNKLHERGTHKFIKKDVMEFLRNESKIYDLIVLDPPTFSNSKNMTETLDIQRDHMWLIDRCMKLLSPDGVLFFSNNFQKFKMDLALSTRHRILDVTEQTIPQDFKKNCHQAFLIMKGDAKKDKPKLDRPKRGGRY